MNIGQVIKLDVSIQKDYLHFLLTELLDNNLQDLDVEVNNIQIHLERSKDITYSIVNKEILLSLPLFIKIRRPSGLFTIEGEGEMVLELKATIDFSYNKMISKTEITNYSWIEKPKLQLGALNMPISSLAALLIDHSGSIITGKIDSAIRQFIVPNSLLDAYFFDKLEEFNEHPKMPISIVPELETIHLIPFDDSEEIVSIKAFISGRLKVRPIGVNSEERIYPDIHWGDQDTQSFMLKQDLILSYQHIINLIEGLLENQDFGGKTIEVEELKIHYDERLNISTRVVKPVAMDIKLTGEPSFDKESGVMDVENIDLHTSSRNLLYKLVNPVIEKVIEKRVLTAFPININDLLMKVISEQLADVNEGSKLINISIFDVVIDDVDFINEGLDVKCSIIRPEVKLVFKENT